MNTQYRKVYPMVMGTTLITLGVAFFWPQWLADKELGVFLMLMGITGIPHGATDHLVYAFVEKKRGNPLAYPRFFLTYLVAILLYSILWYVFPMISLLVFLLISAYHFGQSQLMHVKGAEDHPGKRVLYVIWGFAVLSAIVLFNWASSHEILVSFLSEEILPSPDLGSLRWYIPLLLALLAISGLGLAYHRKAIHIQAFCFEILNLMVLFLLAYHGSLLISFAIYFGLWHALASILAEIGELHQPNNSFTVRTFFQKALPFSFLSFLGMGLLLVFFQWSEGLISPYLLFFIAISTLTLPHVFFMDKLYQRRGHTVASHNPIP